MGSGLKVSGRIIFPGHGDSCVCPTITKKKGMRERKQEREKGMYEPGLRKDPRDCCRSWAV